MSNSYQNTYRKLLTISLLAIIFSSNFTVFAQTRRTNPTNQSKCSGAWTGMVKYNRTQTNTDNKTTPRASMMGEDSTNREMKYEFKGRVLVSESPNKDGSTRAKAVINSKMTSEEKTSSKEKVSCDRGKTWQTQTEKFYF